MSKILILNILQLILVVNAIEIRAGDYHDNYVISQAENGTYYLDPKLDHYYTLIFFHGLGGVNSGVIDFMLGGKEPKLEGDDLIVDKHTRIIIP